MQEVPSFRSILVALWNQYRQANQVCQKVRDMRRLIARVLDPISSLVSKEFGFQPCIVTPSVLGEMAISYHQLSDIHMQIHSEIARIWSASEYATLPE